MLLTEAEGKQLISSAHIQIPTGQLVKNLSEVEKYPGPWPVMVKAQVLHGNRGQQGLVKKAQDQSELVAAAQLLFKSQDLHQQPITQVLLEQALEFSQPIYLSLGYDTHYRQLVIRYSPEGGEGMDERGSSITTLPISIHTQPTQFEPQPSLVPLIQQLHALFLEIDATLIEINPLVNVSGQWVCLDAKIELDETARFRHPEWEDYSERSALGRPWTDRETAAHTVSHSDHRGVAGESFFEFEGGELGVMASGGGASTLAMDALLAVGIKPANYTEYSGNPTREKVKALTDVVLSIPGLKGLYVVGSNANFTDIYETLSGVVDGLLASSLPADFPILIRRGGPRWQEAFQMVEDRLKARQFRLKLLGPDFPLVQTAREMKKMLKDHA